MLSKRTLVGLAPLLAVVAFAVVPAMAQASPEWLVNGVAISGASVAVKSHNVNGGFVLKTAGGGEIKCTTLSDTGTLLKGSPGTGKASLTFTGCASEICPDPPNVLTIDPFNVELLLVSTTALDVDLLEPALVLCNGELIGPVEETKAGGIPATISGKKLVFSKAGNLTFLSEPATISGEDEQEGTSGEAITVS